MPSEPAMKMTAPPFLDAGRPRTAAAELHIDCGELAMVRIHEQSTVRRRGIPTGTRSN